MSAGNFLLLFLGEEPSWMRIVDGQSAARSLGFDALPLHENEDETETTVLVVPGCDVALHWADIPAGLSVAQVSAASRILADDVSSQPVEQIHIAFDRASDDGQRCVAITAHTKMADWLAQAAELGIDPDSIIPEPLLLAPAEAGARIFRHASLDIVRGPKRAFAVEPEIAALLLGDEPVERLTIADFERDIGTVLEIAPLNLRQGDYAKRRRWKIGGDDLRRAVLLVAVILLVTLLIQFTMIARYSFAADALEREAVERARDAIPGSVEIVDPEGQLRERVHNLGGGPGYGEIASATFTAIRDTAGVELQIMIYRSDNGLQFTAAAPGQAEFVALQQRMMSAGLIVTSGSIRDGGGHQIAEFTVRAP